MGRRRAEVLEDLGLEGPGFCSDGVNSGSASELKSISLSLA